MKTYKQIKVKAEKIKKWLDNNNHCDYHTTYIALNVKTYNSNIIGPNEINNFIDTLENFTGEQKEFLKSEVTDIWLLENWNRFLEGQARYFTDDFITGCTVSSQKYWNEEIEKLKKGEKSSYLYINNKRTLENKIKAIEKWNREHRKQEYYLSQLDIEKIGFFGRSGGWLAFYRYEDLNNKIDNCLYEVEYKNKEDSIYYLDKITDIYNACKWLMNEAKEMHEGIPESWKAELSDYYLPDLLEENGFISDDQKIEEKLNAISI